MGIFDMYMWHNIYRRFLIHSHDSLSLVIPNNKTLEHWLLKVTFIALNSHTVLCLIKVNSNTIELIMHASCYCILDLLCVTYPKIRTCAYPWQVIFEINNNPSFKCLEKMFVPGGVLLPLPLTCSFHICSLHHHCWMLKILHWKPHHHQTLKTWKWWCHPQSDSITTACQLLQSC